MIAAPMDALSTKNFKLWLFGNPKQRWLWDKIHRERHVVLLSASKQSCVVMAVAPSDEHPKKYHSNKMAYKDYIQNKISKAKTLKKECTRKILREAANESWIEPLKGTLNNNNIILYNNIFHNMTGILYKILIIFIFNVIYMIKNSTSNKIL